MSKHPVSTPEHEK